mgnify:CR=1 FL=1
MGIALVTGGSRGIGRATALQLAQEGYTVAVNFHHNIRAATEVVNTIVAAGGKAFALRLISAMKARLWQCLNLLTAKVNH